MSLETAQYQHDMAEPSNHGPTSEWEKARTMIEKAEQLLKNAPRKEGDLWRAMGIKANQRWERRNRKIENILLDCEYTVWHDQCSGCGEYSEGGRTHKSAQCRADARYDG